MNQNPFSFYDFLGYMIPGALLLYVGTFIFGVDGIVKALNLNGLNDSADGQLLGFIPAVILSYLLGHVLAIGSSALIETFANCSNGYPSEFLFDVHPKKYLSSDSCWNNSGRVILWLLIFPVSIFKFFLKDVLKIKIFDQAKPLPKPLREATFSKCKQVLDELIKVDTANLKIEKGIDGDYLRLLYHFVFEHSERHAGKLQNYVALYGFSRNVSFVFVLLFWWASYACVFADGLGVGVFHAVVFGSLAYVFYIGFIKFYRRYSLEAVMAASVCCRKDG